MPGDPLWMKALLAVHIAAGALCLVLAPLVLSVTKGGPAHRRWGRIYFWSMTAVAASALPMALYHSILFLTLISVLSFYLAFSGYRVLLLRRQGRAAGFLDWLAALAMFASCASLVAFGMMRPHWIETMGLVAVLLGGAGCIAAISDFHRFLQPAGQGTLWLGIHLGRFLGSYVATWTAVSAVVLSPLLPHQFLMVWLWPSLVGLPLILQAGFYYRRKFSRPVRA